MSDLPSEFLTADDIPINKTHFPNPHRYPYDFGSSSSTESESDDDDHLAGLTHRFNRSVSLQERLQIHNPIQKKRVFSSSPESTLNWNVSSPVSPLVHSDEDSWERIYAAAGQIARMKMNMNMTIINANDDVFATRNLLGPPPLHRHHHPNCSNWHRENEEFIRQRQFLQRLNYVGGGRCGTSQSVGLRQAAWPPQVENLRHQQPVNAFAIKSVLAGYGGGCGRGTAADKKECAGTGVFLPRTGYSHGPPKSKKNPACSGGHLPARVVAQSCNKTMGPINPQPQPNIYSGFVPHHQVPPHHLNRAELAEIVMARRHAAMLAQQQRRSTILVGVQERQIGGHPELVLPQEWTY